MKLEMVKGLALLKATTKKESERLMLYYLGKTPAPERVEVVSQEMPAPRKYTHSPQFLAKQRGRKSWRNTPKTKCEYGCGEFKNLAAHMLQKHGQGKDGVPRKPNLGAYLGRKGPRTASPEGDKAVTREYLDISHIGE